MNYDAMVRQAMRRAIMGHVRWFKRQAFREVEWIACPIMGYLVSRENCEADHNPMTFMEISQAFIDKQRLDWNDIELDDVTEPWMKRTHYALTDLDLWSKWVAYHFTNATLRIVSMHGHKRKRFWCTYKGREGWLYA